MKFRRLSSQILQHMYITSRPFSSALYRYTHRWVNLNDTRYEITGFGKKTKDLIHNTFVKTLDKIVTVEIEFIRVIHKLFIVFIIFSFIKLIVHILSK